jgi:MerR family transcriptional regulator, copper efflux regulator
MSDTTTVSYPERATCSLSPNTLSERRSAWRSLIAQALHRRVEPGRVLSTFPNGPEIARSLAQLVEAENDCCPFLEFDIRESDSTIEVELRYPPEFAATLASVLGTR